MVDQRPQRALAIYAKGNQIKRLDSSTYKVKSQSGNGWYLVTKKGEEWVCECPDHQFRQTVCKHIHIRSVQSDPSRLDYYFTRHIPRN